MTTIKGLGPNMLLTMSIKYCIIIVLDMLQFILYLS